MAVEERPHQNLNVTGLFGVEIDPSYKEEIRHFAEDFEIENLPDEKYMVVTLGILEDEDMTPVHSIMNGPLIMSDFLVYIDDSGESDVLMVAFESAVGEQKIDNLRDEYDLIEEVDEENPYDLSFVLSYNYEGDQDQEVLDDLSYKFNQYFPIIEASKEITGYYDLEEVDAMVFGIRPSDMFD